MPSIEIINCNHDPFDCGTVLKVRQGSEWTNDYGQKFPAIPLYAVDCRCGRREHNALTYTADKAKAYAKYEDRIIRQDAKDRAAA